MGLQRVCVFPWAAQHGDGPRMHRISALQQGARFREARRVHLVPKLHTLTPFARAMPPRRAAAKENAASNASVATVLTLEVTAGPCKGTVFADQARA